MPPRAESNATSVKVKSYAASILGAKPGMTQIEPH